MIEVLAIVGVLLAIWLALWFFRSRTNRTACELTVSISVDAHQFSEAMEELGRLTDGNRA